METTKKGSVIIYILLSVMLAAVAAAVVLGIFSLLKIGDMSEDIVEFGDFIEYYKEKEKEGEDVAQENDVRIGSAYMIKSTETISNAYKSGDTSALTDKEKETLDMASAILAEIIKPEMTEYEKEIAVYDWMCANLKHDEGGIVAIPTTQEDCDNPYGVLKYHNAVCVGYATTFRMFMHMMDITCMVVHDSWLSHSWDLVQLDGNWYHTDIYMDVSSGNYASFNMNDEMCSSGHEWNREFFPAANGLEYCYIYRNSEELTDPFTVPNIIKTGMNGDKDSFFFRLPSPTDYDCAVLETIMTRIAEYINPNYYDTEGKFVTIDATATEFDNKIFDGVSDVTTDKTIDAVMPGDGGNTYLSWHWVAIPSDGSCLLSVFIETYGSSEPDVVLNEDDYGRIDSAVKDAFGELQTEDDTYYGSVILTSEADELYTEPYIVIGSEGLYYVIITPDAASFTVDEVVSVFTAGANITFLCGQTFNFPDYGELDIQAEISGAYVAHDVVYG